MIVAESRRGRRLVGRLDRGFDLLESLLEVCRTHGVRAAEVRAFGELEQVSLTEYDQRGRAWRPPKRFDAQFEIVNLTGNISEKDGKLFAHAHVSLSRERDNGIELIGGHLVAGRVFSLEFVLEVFDDLVLRRAADPSTGLLLWREAITLTEENPQAAPPPVAFEAPARAKAMPHVDNTPSWQEVAAASAQAAAAKAEVDAEVARTAPPSEFDEDTRPSPGDWIDHPKFGRCQVERIEGEFEFVSARMRNQRLIRLSLDVLTLTPVGREEGRLLFRAEPGRR